MTDAGPLNHRCVRELNKKMWNSSKQHSTSTSAVSNTFIFQWILEFQKRGYTQTWDGLSFILCWHCPHNFYDTMLFYPESEIHQFKCEVILSTFSSYSPCQMNEYKCKVKGSFPWWNKVTLTWLRSAKKLDYYWALDLSYLLSIK